MNKEVMSQEIDALLSTLDFIQEAQSFIKLKLINLLAQKVQKEVIDWAEVLHQEILNRETAVQLLKNDILRLANQIKVKVTINHKVHADSIVLFKKYKQQVGYIETEFFTWKNHANDKMETALN